MSRPGALLPRTPEATRGLQVLVAALCFLACLAVVGGLATNRAAQGWAQQFRGEATVLVRPRVGETGAEAAGRAAQALAAVPGVEEAEVLSRRAAEDLLRPWVGEAALGDLPTPWLLTVRLERRSPASAVSLGRAFAEAGVDGTVDDHGLWRAEVTRSARTIDLLAFAGLLVTATIAAAAIVWTARAGVAAEADLIRILSRQGASDRQIALLYARRHAILAAQAGAAGALGAALVASAICFAGGADGIIPALPVAWSDLVWLSPCPVLAASVGAVAAGFGALARTTGRAK